jgi:hypothetical protein
MANKQRNCYPDLVPLRSCKVACRDLAGNDHTVDVTAESLYEAVGKALSILRQNEWVEEIGEGLTEVRVRISQPAVEHKVLVKDFRRWLKSHARTPAETALKRKLSDILQNGAPGR